MKLTQIGEFGVIQRIRSTLRDFQQGAIVGIGDDTAVIELHFFLATRMESSGSKCFRYCSYRRESQLLSGFARSF